MWDVSAFIQAGDPGEVGNGPSLFVGRSAFLLEPEGVVAIMRSWKHSGFSVDQSVRLEGGDQQGVQRLIQYFLRCPFSQARMIRLRPGRATAGQVEVTEAGKVIYKTEHNAVGRFPEPGDEELLAGPSRNFQIFDPLDFLAACPPQLAERRQERCQTEVIEKLRCAKRTSILGKLTGRAWEAHSPALWALGGARRRHGLPASREPMAAGRRFGAQSHPVSP
jgi:hypothetical protein